jgi:alpha-tubulin suppressor-like RCC1 family protein
MVMATTIRPSFALIMVAACGVDEPAPATSTQDDALAQHVTAGARPHTTLAVGGFHTCAILGNGTVTCSGLGAEGQLGNGGFADSPNRVLAIGIANAVSIAAGRYHSCASLVDGRVRCWGYAGYGQTGDASFSNTALPHAVMVQTFFGGLVPLVQVVDVVAGPEHSCARTYDGYVYCWGLNNNGQLGNGNTANFNTASRAQISGVTALAAGALHTCALLGDHTVWCWGANGDGQLGDGTQDGHVLPVQVVGITNATAIAASEFGTCARLVDATVQCWGRGSLGQLGNNTQTAAQLTPTPVREPANNNDLFDIRSITAGAYHYCAIRSTGATVCWGYNWYGQLGNNSTALATLPVPVATFGGQHRPAAISSGLYTTCADTSYGQTYCWGNNWYGTFGNGGTVDSPVPTLAFGGVYMRKAGQRLVAGDRHACVMSSFFGQPYCWGANDAGQLGDPHPAQRTPWGVALTDIIAMSAGANHTCALREDSSVWCWGYDQDDELLDGSYMNQSSPVRANVTSNLIAIADQCVLHSDGFVLCWGDNRYGQVGDGTNLGPRPAQVVQGLPSIVAISGSDRTRCALGTDGTVWCWGDNSHGEVGALPATDTKRPVQVAGIANAIAVASGADSTCALIEGGTLRCWGANTRGQLGNNQLGGQSWMPVQVMGLSSVVAVAMSSSSQHVCALDIAGAPYCWGSNNYGQVDSSFADRPAPVPVANLGTIVTGGPVIELAVGGTSSYALRVDTGLWSWGNNTSGQLGDNLAEWWTATPVHAWIDPD